MRKQTIEDEHISLHDLEELIASDAALELSDKTLQRIEQSRSYLDDKLASSDEQFYGINTGFGAFCNVTIAAGEIEELQHNLVRSHACGAGDPVPEPVTRLMLLFKVLNLSKGFSGVTREVVQRLLDLYNHDVLPVIYQAGSLGASGDLAPLAHLSLPLIGEGEVWQDGKIVEADQVLQDFKLEPLHLRSKEGLALLNGTQFMSAYAFECYTKSQYLMEWAHMIAALSIEAFDARIEPFDALIHSIRQTGLQDVVAAIIREYLDGSELAARKKVQVQDPYSFRCIPQVHGASMHAFEHVGEVLEDELNSVTDNPNIFSEQDKILSGGNFHGQPLALVLDYAAMAIAEIGSISERRTYQLLNGERGLPVFLTTQGGLHSGLMIPQYTAASLVSKNKQLCTPASVDSIPSSNGQEDHVSMGANGATKLYQVVENVHDILSIELLTAAQAIEFQRPAKSSEVMERMIGALREELPFTDKDRVLRNDMQACRQFIAQHHPGEFLEQ